MFVMPMVWLSYSIWFILMHLRMWMTDLTSLMAQTAAISMMVLVVSTHFGTAVFSIILSKTSLLSIISLYYP